MPRLHTTWSSWALDSIGVWYPRQRRVMLNGEPFREYVVTGLTFAPAAADSFAIPDSVRAAFVRRRETAPTPAALSPTPVGDDVLLFLGGYQASVVRQPDGLVILEAPVSVDKSRRILADLRARYPGMPVKAVVSTSPMWMHIGGLAEYARLGIPIYLRGANVPEIRRLLDGVPTARLRPVEAPLSLGHGKTELRLVPALGPHGGAMMLVMLPQAHLLYASDVLVPDTFEPVFSAAYRAELIRTVTALQLDVTTVFGLHVAPMLWQQVVDGAPIVVARAGTG